MLVYLLFLSLLLTPTSRQELEESPCDLADCLKRIGPNVPVTVLDLREADLGGRWSNGGGLSGFHLYLFDDLSYIYTVWADILPETIYHKGQWRVVDGVVRLSPDPDVTWDDPARDTRYLLFRIGNQPDRLLLGLDFRLAVFEKAARDTPGTRATWLRLASFTREGEWSPGESENRKKKLLKCCWRPEHFAEDD